MKLQSKQPRGHVLPPRPEAAKIADLLNAAHQEGHAWGDMAVICRRYDEMDECPQALSRWQLPRMLLVTVSGDGGFGRTLGDER